MGRRLFGLASLAALFEEACQARGGLLRQVRAGRLPTQPRVRTASAGSLRLEDPDVPVKSQSNASNRVPAQINLSGRSLGIRMVLGPHSSPGGAEKREGAMT